MSRVVVNGREPSGGAFAFDSLESLCTALRARAPIRRLLIANNGLAAVKGIDSIRSWLYEHIGDPEAVQFVVMATPEDLKANAEFISMADQHVSVPGGPNGNNYANVDLIMHTALQNTCNAIYPGWGHASENPALPRECDKSRKVIFLGPSEDAMFALGDKIASTIVAQSNGVPTVPWSGDSIRLPPGVFDVDAVTYDRAYVTSPEECETVCRRIGFPVMIKASEGGGGKGIRCCTSLAQVKDMYFAVSEEVKGCHIFVMRMLTNVRHLEVQLLADAYDNCIAVRTRDCSVQRRHQKIVEEGPAFDVDPAVIEAMERSAIQLARAVNYRGLGTVEYMYDKETKKFFFLELNPRIQVEHPVSELISGVNLPAALLCVGMGVPLHCIPEVRTFYGEEPYATTAIDFAHRQPVPPKCHTIAVRITAEDTDEGFRPTSGKVEEITFRNSKECWGYFSVGSGGAIHPYADSQFGHIFSSGETREDARRGAVMALRNLVIRGEIRTSSPYVLELLETPAFRDCDVSTAWLDGLIAKRAAEAPTQHGIHTALIAANIFRSLRTFQQNMDRYLSFLTAGHVPSTEYLSNYQVESYVSRGAKYTVSSGRVSEQEYALCLNGSIVHVPYRILKSGALQLTVGAKTVVAYVEKEPNNLRVTIGGKVHSFSGDVDPTKIHASVPGRLVRYVIENDGHVNEGGTFAEVEVMKMILPLRAPTSGRLHHRAVPGSTVVMGSLLADITPDDPSKVSRPTDIKEPWPNALLIDRAFERPDGVTRARRGAEGLWNLVCGYHFAEIPIEERTKQIFEDLSSLMLSSVTLRSVHPAFLEPALCEDDGLSPKERMKAVMAAVIDQFIATEKPFDQCTRQESIEALREQHKGDERNVFYADYAHRQDCHHQVIEAILSYLEEDNYTLMKLLQGELTKLVEFQSYMHGSLLLHARYLLRQCSLPSVRERTTQFAQKLEEGSMKDLVAGSYGNDLLCSIMFDRHMTHLVQVCLEFFIRREYFGESNISDLDIFKVKGCWYASYRYEPIEGAAGLEIGERRDFSSANRPSTFHGACMVFADVVVLQANLATTLENNVARMTPDTAVCIVFVSTSRESTQEGTSALFERLLEEAAASVAEGQAPDEGAVPFSSFPALETICFVVHGMSEGPHVFSYRRAKGFREDKLLRNVLPQSAQRLELDRLDNYDVAMYPSPYKEVHVFKAMPKKTGASPLENRLFARVAVTPYDMGMEPWTEGTDIDAGHMLAKCMAALEVARNDISLKYPASNHVFVKMIELTFDVTMLQKLLAAAASSYQARLIQLHVHEVELSFQVKVPSGLIPMRVVVTSPSGYGIVVHVYYETVEDGRTYLHRAETSEDIISSLSMSGDYLVDLNPASPITLKNSPQAAKTISKLEALRELLPSKKHVASAAVNSSAGDGGTSSSGKGPSRVLLGPYPNLSVKEVKRLQARSGNTTYFEDWPELLRLILRKDWTTMRHARHLRRTCVPATPLYATRLYMGHDGRTLTTEVPEKDSSGMAVWIVEYSPPSYHDPESLVAETRRFVMVANDITFQSGSFAVPEDMVFKAASGLARKERLPFVYISANSGARLGLVQEVKKRFLVALSEKGEIDYLYLTEADYNYLTDAKKISVAAECRVVGTEKRFVLQGIVGAADDYIGVENLRGSGLVAGEMSKNYSEIPTISVVTGRSVGIGSYLNRLGRRVIQTADSPLILTGAGALNRLLGKDVYADNSQLGGKQIMVPNGVTHWNTKHDYGSARALLRWLDFVPAVTHPTRCMPRPLTLPTDDPVDRDVTYSPEDANTPYDPRLLATGFQERLGLFDRGSWSETLEGWAKSVVTGRATLGGIPCGVIMVETRLSKKYDPADPADPTSSASFTAQAGQVWFPDSARKTADALDDFHHERLPCFILANWRGFSGGMRDMFDEVLKFGASIVDNLRVYTAPVFIYIPPFGELRGGAWVVVDPVINHNGVVEMYCDPTSRGGILEPSGVVEIKFRDNDVRELIRRNEPALATMEPKAARELESKKLPVYRDVAVRFADLHDNHIRMKAKGVVRDVIPWKDSRRVFYHKLQRKLLELDIANDLVEVGIAHDLAHAVRCIEERYASEHPTQAGDAGTPPWGTDDVAQHRWLQGVKRAGNAGWALGEAPVTRTERVQRLRHLLAECKMEDGSMEECLADLFTDPEIAHAAMGALRGSHSRGVSGVELSATADAGATH